MTKETESQVIKRTQSRIYFQHEDMDYYFQWILSRQGTQGSELGECFYTARRITDGDPKSWQEAWISTAEQVESKAESQLKAEHTVSARESYLRACSYYRASLMIMHPNTSGFRPTINRMQLCFSKAISLLDNPVEKTEVPFQGTSLPALFAQVDKSGQKRRTLIQIGGGETFAEDLYFYIVPAALRRGYNVLIVDLPGQGDNPLRGLIWDLNTGVQLTAIVDYAISRTEIDEEKIAAYGISGGGYFLGRAATVEQRIKAYVLNPPLFDFVRIFKRRWKAVADEVSTCYEAQSNWRKGIDPNAPPINAKSPEDLAALKRAARDLMWNPEDLKAPTLCIAGLGEHAQWIEQTKECYLRQKHGQKELILFPETEGADSHCQFDNLSAMSQSVFDWLDEVLSKPTFSPKS